MTTDNTPLNADDELRESILQDIYNAAVWREHLGAIKGEAEFGDKDRHKDRLDGSGRVADLVMNKILADRKKHELQAYSDGFQKASKGAFKSQQAAKREAVEAVLDELKEEGISCIDPAGHPTYVVPLSAIEQLEAEL